MNNKITELESKSIVQLEDYAINIDLDKLKKIINHLSNLYYNVGESGLSDFRFDILKEILETRDPTYEIGVGANVGVNESVKLPFFLGSMPKIKPDDIDKLKRWLAKNLVSNYMISGKLDGVSCLAVYKEGKPVELYTRGSGDVGKNISWLEKFVETIPLKLDKDIKDRKSGG